MTPTIVLQNGQPILVVGGAGSSTIISGVLQTLLNDLVIWKFDLHRALFAGRVHHQWQPDRLEVEAKAFAPITEDRLKKKGFGLHSPRFLTQVQAVDFNPVTQLFTAVHDPRDHGGAEAK